MPSCLPCLHASKPLSSTTTTSKTCTPTPLLQPHFCTLGKTVPGASFLWKMAVMVQPSSFLPVKSKILLLTACPTKVCFSAFPYDSTLSYVSNTTFLLHWFVWWHHWGFAAPHSPNLTRHQRSSSVAAALQRHLRWLMMHEQHRRGWQRSRGKRCSCALLFDVSDVWRGAGTTPRGRRPCLTSGALRKP